MIETAQQEALEIEKASLKRERRMEDPILGLQASASSSVDVQRLMAKLQHRFSDSMDVAHLIESEVNQRTAELARRANYDSLTHLPNRSYFHDILENLIQHSNETSLPFSLLFLDLDGFKSVNDTLGHQVGDELLRHVSGRLVAAVREGDVVSRLGGDEFVILLAGLNQREEIETICSRIITEISNPYWFDGQEVQTTTSIGIATFPNDTRLSSELIEKSDQALYVSKQDGKHTFRFYDDVKHEVPGQPHQNQVDFEQSIAEGRFAIEIEPQVDLKQNRIVGGMLAAYWLLESGEKLAYEEWALLLNQSKNRLLLATWLLDSACFYAQRWTDIDAEFVVTVPVLDALAAKSDLVTVLMHKMQQAHLLPNQCQFAFSLKQLAEVDGLVARLTELSAAGGQLTLTGLGTNAFDLGALSALSVQEFKFDGVWLHQAMQAEAGHKWIQALIQMGKSLDASMIATEVSSKTEVNLLADWGCQLGQGTYWGSSITCEAFEQGNALDVKNA